TIAFNQLDDLTIMIEELPSPGLSNLIQISVNDQLLWQQFMQPRMDALEYFAENAYETVLQYILNYQEIQNQLGSQDQKGTGVY
ncbi:MAG: CsgE family curli-type amyloid fiber assembly protein, partial [Runella zeae]